MLINISKSKENLDVSYWLGLWPLLDYLNFFLFYVNSSQRYHIVKYNVMITGPANCELYIVFLATTMSSFLYRIIVATTSLHRYHTTARTRQPHYHHTHGTLPPMPWNKSRYDVCRLNRPGVKFKYRPKPWWCIVYIYGHHPTLC